MMRTTSASAPSTRSSATASPARAVGETVHQKVIVKDLYVKREKGWIVSELSVTNEAGELLLTSSHTSVLSLTRKHQDND